MAQAFLAKVKLSQIDPLHLAQLNALITTTDMKSAIASLATLGLDGYTSEFFKISADLVAPTLVSVYQMILNGGKYPPSGFQAYINLVPKRAKTLIMSAFTGCDWPSRNLVLMAHSFT